MPEIETLSLRLDGWRLHVTLNRPEVRNAMSARMVRELVATMEAIAGDDSVRAVILRGAGGHFCAGGDVKDMAMARQAEPGPDGRDPVEVLNRGFGKMLQAIEALPQPVIAVCEGAVMGGGFGLACVADVTIAVHGARFRLPETGLGLTPAQIAPFIVRRIGLTHARMLGVTGASIEADEAVRLGVAHIVASDGIAALKEVLERIGRCGPRAVAATKQLMLQVGRVPLDELLDSAAADFALRTRSDEAAAGITSFLSKTPPPWAREES
ncbi:MAG: enoyl-CoA hydratase/isomerase family protein [Deltaproteobacteria bacterium]|nr:enoyl-CoA hydratase/isomerase family protein [Deltaproteobacteria bacterium]